MSTIGPISIAANTDDGEIDGSGPAFYVNGEDGSNDWIGSSSGGVLSIGFFRFTLPSEIPSGATIDAGTKLELYGVDSYGWEATDFLEIVAEQSADPAAETDTTYPTFCTTVIRWPAAGGLTWNTGSYNSRDIVALIQELVDDYGGLASSAHIQLYVRAGGAYNGWLAAEDYNSAGSNVAKLTIEYTAAGGAQSIVPLLGDTMGGGCNSMRGM